MSSVVAVLVLVLLAMVAGFGGGAGFAVVLARQLDKEITKRIEEWERRADEDGPS